jgi:hypothetical protein
MMDTAPKEEHPAAASAAATDHAGESQFPRAIAVQFGVIATILIFAACATLVIMRSATVDVPNAMLVVRGTPAWDGCVAYVDGINLPKPQAGELAKRSNYVVTFHVVPGEYSFTIRRDLGIVYTDDFVLTDRDRIQIVNLPETPGSVQAATSQPTWQSAGEGFQVRSFGR